MFLSVHFQGRETEVSNYGPRHVEREEGVNTDSADDETAGSTQRRPNSLLCSLYIVLGGSTHHELKKRINTKQTQSIKQATHRHASQLVTTSDH